MSDFWTDERIGELKAQFEAGLTASEIMRALGAMSRNAIIGKLHRLGLKRGDPEGLGNRIRQGIANRPRVPLLRTPAVQQPASPKMNPAPVSESPVAPAPPALTLDPAEIPASQRKQLLELGNDDCRFPYGDPGTPDFFFCGAPEADFAGRVPYCPRHRAVAYRRGGE